MDVGAVEILNLDIMKWRKGPTLPSTAYQSVVYEDILYVADSTNDVYGLGSDKQAEWKFINNVGNSSSVVIPSSHPPIVNSEMLGC